MVVTPEGKCSKRNLRCGLGMIHHFRIVFLRCKKINMEFKVWVIGVNNADLNVVWN